MKKLFFTLALALGMVLTASAQYNGLFGYGPAKGDNGELYWDSEQRTGLVGFSLPSQHGDGGDQPAPLGMGTALLLGLGATYFVAKKRKEK